MLPRGVIPVTSGWLLVPGGWAFTPSGYHLKPGPHRLEPDRQTFGTLGRSGCLRPRYESRIDTSGRLVPFAPAWPADLCASSTQPAIVYCATKWASAIAHSSCIATHAPRVLNLQYMLSGRDSSDVMLKYSATRLSIRLGNGAVRTLSRHRKSIFVLDPTTPCVVVVLFLSPAGHDSGSMRRGARASRKTVLYCQGQASVSPVAVLWGSITDSNLPYRSQLLASSAYPKPERRAYTISESLYWT